MRNEAFVDAALSLLSLYASIRGTTPPFTAAEEGRSKAKNDWIRKFGMTRISTVYHLALGVFTILECKSIFEMDAVTLQRWHLNRSHWLYRGMLAVNMLGGALRVICFKALGRFFTFDLAVQSGQKVIQSGPYAFVRHPSYSAMLLHLIGTCFSGLVYGPLMPPQWQSKSAAYLSTGMTILAAILINLRINDEEKMLVGELGDEYKAYRQNVRYKLVPFVL